MGPYLSCRRYGWYRLAVWMASDKASSTKHIQMMGTCAHAFA